MRFGLIGVGSIGAVRAAALAKSAHAELVCVHDLDRARAAACAPGARFVAEPEMLISDPDVEAVIIATPPQFHEAFAVQALGAGKHVLVEKPMAPSVEACRRMVATSLEADRLLSIGFNHRYFAALKLVRDVVGSGRLGRLSHIKAFTGHVGLSEFKSAWMYDPAVMGGGALADNGVHMLDLCRYLMGDFTEVYGHVSDHVWNLGGAEDNAFALFRNGAGVTASLHASWSEWKGYRFHIEAYGDRGMARAYYAPMAATVIDFDRASGRRHVRRRFYPAAILREKLRGWQSTVCMAFVEELKDFAAAAQGRDAPRLATGADGLRCAQIAAAVYESSRSGHMVHLPPLN